MLDAQFALNEGAGGELDGNGKPLALRIEAGEKVYQDFSLDTSDVGGHSSRPTRNNPIARLSAGIARLGAYDFPVALNEATRGYFEAESKLVAPQVAADMRAVLAHPADEAAVDRLWAADPGWNGMLRTTCVATEISGGHAANALPQHAHANVDPVAPATALTAHHGAGAQRRAGPHAHGLNERIRVVSLMNGRRFLYEVVKLYANQP